MRTNASERTLSPAQSGRVYGKLKPSPVGIIRLIKAAGVKEDIPANRAERRRVAHAKKKAPQQ